MGEYAQTLCDVDATDDEAAVLKQRLQDWLINKGIVAAAITNCVLSDDGGHRPAENYGYAIYGRDAGHLDPAVQALSELVASADAGPISLPAILEARRLLMAPDPYADEPGQLRSVQNWIGGSDYSPMGASFVPPPPDRVPTLMNDLLAFADRDDLPIVAQSAIVHAQFESIHPFIDGNGRIGRALLSAVLRRRGLTQVVTVPVASVMLADTETYFARLGDYRRGDVAALVEYVATAAVYASGAAQESARRLAALPARWREAARLRAGSADESLIEALLQTPIFNADTAQSLTGTTDASTYRALGRLVQAGVVEVLSAGSRNRIWAASAVLAELDRLTEAICRRALGL